VKRAALGLMMVLTAASLAVSLGGCALFIAEGQCDITDWEQTHYEYLDEYGYVWVYFRVTNVGSIDIDYYKVWFEVRCSDGSRFQDWTNGGGVSPGMYLSDYTLIDTAGKRAVSVEITGFEVQNWD